VVLHSDGKECSQALALFLNEKGNNCSQMALMETPLSFNVSHTSKKIKRCRFGSSKGVSLNWDCRTMEMSADLSSKLLALTLGRAMLEAIPWTPRVMKSRSVLLWSSPPPAMFVGFLLTSCLCSSLFCFFLLKWKVLLISGSGSYRNGLRISREDSCKHYHQQYQRNQTEKIKNKRKRQ